MTEHGEMQVRWGAWFDWSMEFLVDTDGREEVGNHHGTDYTSLKCQVWTAEKEFVAIESTV